MKALIKEFKEFISRGNVMDSALRSEKERMQQRSIMVPLFLPSLIFC